MDLTLNELFAGSYGWCDTHAGLVLLIAILTPIIGTVAAYIGRHGKTDLDGKYIASAIIAFAVLLVAVEIGSIALAVGPLGRSILDANVVILIAPILCLIGCVLGIRMVFPLNELGSVRTMADLFIFSLACIGVVWFLSKFRGWGILFFGSFTQLLVVGALVLFLLYRLFKRTFGLSKRSKQG